MHTRARDHTMATAPESIFSKLGPWDILVRLADIGANAEIDGSAIPEATVHALLAALEVRHPEVRLAIEEMPSAPMTFTAIDAVIRAAEEAIDARCTNQHAEDLAPDEEVTAVRRRAA